ncbi:MAG: methyltransferase domain-containing protein [Chloroflexales bacterium]
MRESNLHYLVCPECHSDLEIRSISERQGAVLVTAALGCTGCGASYPVIRSIPRFVPMENYAANFGLEWNIHDRTQYDSNNGRSISATRFFEETHWPHDLSGQVILEVGSGSGRFTEPAASTGAFIISMDYSSAVEANYRSNGACENVLIVQGTIYKMPFRPSSFDKVFCFGVLQHTPDVRASFMALPPMLKEGGLLTVDVYKKTFFSTVLATKYYVRVVTRHMDHYTLYRLSKVWVNLLWPLGRKIAKIPRIGASLNWRLLIPDYRCLGLDETQLKEWAYLDIFDKLSPRYDSPQTRTTLRRWFAEAMMTEVEVAYGYNGIEGRGKKPVAR